MVWGTKVGRFAQCMTVALLASTTGCGQASPDGGASETMTPPTLSINGAPQTAQAAVDTPQQAAATGDATVPEKGTAEWVVREIMMLRAQPLDEQNRTEADRQRQLKIIELASEAIAKTHQDPAKVQLFNNGVHFLTEARLALALAGDTEQAHQLADDAESLYQRDPKSFAAVEAAATLVQLAQQNAGRYGRRAPQWSAEYATQARLFAEKFPQEQSRSAVALVSAGRQCETVGLTKEAIDCYRLTRQMFAETPFAAQVAGSLRRLSLPGQPLELAGSTIDGGFVNLDQYTDRVKLIVFWRTDSRGFEEVLPKLKELTARYKTEQLQIIGVNLDLDEVTVDEFLGTHELAWPQIFFAEPERRGGRNPVALHYGITTVPTVWLVSHDNVMLQAIADFSKLDTLVETAVNRK